MTIDYTIVEKDIKIAINSFGDSISGKTIGIEFFERVLHNNN